ncbi:26691_t:CDS:2, partial [Gigaspora margarita]
NEDDFEFQAPTYPGHPGYAEKCLFEQNIIKETLNVIVILGRIFTSKEIVKDCKCDEHENFL